MLLKYIYIYIFIFKKYFQFLRLKTALERVNSPSMPASNIAAVIPVYITDKAG